MKFDYYADPGHGWVRVPIKLILELGIKGHISSSSYILGNNAYLEEDGDAPVFIKAMKKAGKSITFKEYHTDKQSRIRNYKSYNTFADQFDEDFHYNIPLNELDFIELSDDGEFYEVHTKGGISTGFRTHGAIIGPSIAKYRSTKCISYKPPFLVIK